MLIKTPASRPYEHSSTIRVGPPSPGSRCPVQRYLDPLLAHVENGDIDPSFVLTHRTSLERAPEMYETFNDKEDGCIKVTMTP